MTTEEGNKQLELKDIKPIVLVDNLPGDIDQGIPLSCRLSVAWILACIVLPIMAIPVALMRNVAFGLTFGLMGAAWFTWVHLLTRSNRKTWAKDKHLTDGIDFNPVRYVKDLCRRYAAIKQQIAEFNLAIESLRRSTCFVSTSPTYWFGLRQRIVGRQDILTDEVTTAAKRRETIGPLCDQIGDLLKLEFLRNIDPDGFVPIGAIIADNDLERTRKRIADELRFLGLSQKMLPPAPESRRELKRALQTVAKYRELSVIEPEEKK